MLEGKQEVENLPYGVYNGTRHPEKQSVAVLIQLSPPTYGKPTTHHITHAGGQLIEAEIEHT